MRSAKEEAASGRMGEAEECDYEQ